MDEKEFFRDERVAVTSARFIVASQTFAMSNITSVKASRVEPNRAGPILLVLLGIACLAGQIWFGFFLISGGILWFMADKSRHYVVLNTAGGETKALASNKPDYIAKVVKALNDAIVHRG